MYRSKSEARKQADESNVWGVCRFAPRGAAKGRESKTSGQMRHDKREIREQATARGIREIEIEIDMKIERAKEREER